MRATNTKARLLWSVLLSLVMATSGWSPAAIAYALEGGDGQPEPPLVVPAAEDNNAKEAGEIVEVDATSSETVDPIAPVEENGDEEAPTLNAQAETAAAEVGGQEYATLAKAVEAAEDGQTIKLLADKDYVSYLEVNKNITLDLNGYTVSSKNSRTSSSDVPPLQDSSTIWVCRGKVVTIKDTSEQASGRIVNSKESSDGMGIYNRGTVYLESGTDVSDYGYGIRNNGGLVVINGGKVTGKVVGVELYEDLDEIIRASRTRTRQTWSSMAV